MTLKEMHAKAGPLSNYMFYIVVAFLWYLVDVIFFSTQAVLSNGPLQTYLSLGTSILLAPFIFAGLFGGIHQQQQTQDNLSTGGFIKGIKLHYWRMLQIGVLSFAFIIAIEILLTVLSGSSQPELFGIKLLDIIGIPYSALTLFWSAAIVVEQKLFRSLLSAIKLFFFNPYALLLGVFWGFVRQADTTLMDSALIKQAPFAIYFLLAAIYATLRILVSVYSLTLYKQINGDGLNVSSEHAPETETAGDGLAKASFGFAFAAFLPIVHLVALVLGIMAIRRKKQFVMKASIACLVGGFFTIFYFLMITGLIVGNIFPAKDPGYSFLSESNASLQPQVALLGKGDFQEVRQQLERDTTVSASRDWTVDCILAIAASNDGLARQKSCA
jgi:hypothetical protein